MRRAFSGARVPQGATNKFYLTIQRPQVSSSSVQAHTPLPRQMLSSYGSRGLEQIDRRDTQYDAHSCRHFVPS